DDVWALSLSGTPQWTRIEATGVAPAPRYRHSAIYDPVRDRMIVFGGKGDSTSFNDTWALSLGEVPAWSRIQTAGTLPRTRASHSAIYDPVRSRLISFGGIGAASEDPINEAWALTLVPAPSWSRIEAAGAPPAPRKGHVAIYDRFRDRMVGYGGYGDPGRVFLNF